MAKRKTTVYLDEEVLRAARVLAARTGRKDSDVVQEALRRYLGIDAVDTVWARSDLDEDQAMSLGSEAVRKARRVRA